MLNYDMKTGSAAHIRKAIKIIGIFAVICFFISNALHMAGIVSYESFPTTEEAYKNWMKLPRTIIEVGRWTAVAGLFFALAVAGLLIAHCIMQYLKINKTNVKNELTVNVVNTIVSIVILSFVIYALTFVFDKDKWSFVEREGIVSPYNPLFGEKTHYAFVAVGILLATTLYATVFAGAYKRPGIVGKETNIKMFRTTAIYMFSLAMIGLVAAGCVAAGGLRNLEDIAKKVSEAKSQEDLNNYRSQMFETWGSVYEMKFLLGLIGTIALMALTLIPYGILGFTDEKEKNKTIILYAVFGALVLAFFIAASAMAKMGDLDKLAEGKQPKWMTKTATVGAITLVAYVLALITGSVAFGTTHKLETKVNKAVAAQPAA